MATPRAAVPPPGPGNGLATAGMILGILGLALCWIPFFGWILAVVGIVLGAIGWSKANKGARGKGMAIAGVVCGVVGILAGVAVFAVTMVAVKSFDRYIERSKGVESRLELRSMGTQIKMFYMENAQLPDSASVMPGADGDACTQPNDKFAARPQADWDAAGWQNIGFYVDEPARFSYHWERISPTEGVGLAVGDLDCDGNLSTLTMHVQVVDGNVETTFEGPTPD